VIPWGFQIENRPESMCDSHIFSNTYPTLVGIVKTYVNNNGGAQEKGKIGWNWVYHKNWWFFFVVHLELNFNLFFSVFFFNLTLFMSKPRVLVLCFHYFRDIVVPFQVHQTLYYFIKCQKLRSFLVENFKNYCLSKSNFVH
jgi:hypothetical protein